jgi:peptidoglycan/LPS O-acetylase OafA/YrhL
MPARTTRRRSDPQGSRRVEWLDGLRAAAALFVVIHHSWLAVFPAFPRNTGPWYVGWMLYGQLAVAVFIVVSGFSLALGPLRHGGKLPNGVKAFVGRRFWRIVPPYWAALVLSTIAAGFLVQPRIGVHALERAFVVHGLMLQDIIGSASPNGAFWSIAIEWQIYFVFPLILWLSRRTSMRNAMAFTVVLVLAVHGLSDVNAAFAKVDRLVPQFLGLFTIGVFAVYLGAMENAARLRPLFTAVGGLMIGGFVALALTKGSVWIVDNYFWIDLLFGTGVACLMMVMYSGGLAPLRRVLASRPGVMLGAFSYSIYLLHAPMVGVADQYVFGPLHLAPIVTLGLILGLGVPVILVVCYGFHLVFEAPFMRNRGVGAFREMPLIGALVVRREAHSAPGPAAVSGDVASAREAA